MWETPNPLPLFAGLLATKSGLVFTGDERGYFMALDGTTGKTLWQFQTGSGINASPITYELDGHQYVAVLSGLGGDPSFYYPGPKGGMLWVFSVDGGHQPGTASNPEPIEGALPVIAEVTIRHLWAVIVFAAVGFVTAAALWHRPPAGTPPAVAGSSQELHDPLLGQTKVPLRTASTSTGRTVRSATATVVGAAPICSRPSSPTSSSRPPF